jgi:flagellar biosynthesis/type III secretory pathway protein FliH
MPISHLLQDFGNYHGSGADPVISDATLEEHQLEAFEQGYQAGWDDSARAHAEDQARVSEALAATLQQFSFTFHDAQLQILNALRPLFAQIAETLLPEMARATLPHLVAEHLSALAAEAAGDTLILKVAETDRPALETAIRKHGSYSIRIVTNPGFAPGHLELTSGQEERSIDLTKVVSEVAEALNAFGMEAERTPENG